MPPRRTAALLPALLALSGCQLIREASIRECAEFFDNSRDPQMNDESFRRACTCAVDREAAGQTPIASVPPRPDPALGEFRRHLPDCIAANGGRATGVAARESSGAEPRLPVFDPATGRTTEPPGQVMPGPGDGGEPPPPEEPPPGADGYGPGNPPPPVVGARRDAEQAIDDAQRDLENAMRALEGR
ncbi:MAG: hypothetical protein AB7O91_02535 [Sphingomonas sp.]